jgi:hypothetical protein
MNCILGNEGGGGGAVGRALIKTSSGAYSSTQSPALSVIITQARLVAQ